MKTIIILTSALLMCTGCCKTYTVNHGDGELKIKVKRDGTVKKIENVTKGLEETFD